jgi:hypothetical protein
MNRHAWKLAVVLILLVQSLLAQVVASNRSPSGKMLITVLVRPNHLHIQQGDDLGVEVTLTAGSEGAYVPNFFGDFNQTRQTGFWANIFTPQGKLASEMNNGCAGDELFGGTPLRELLAKRYIFLKPGEGRLWHTTMTKITKSPGPYEVQAGYISDRAQIQQIAALPEVHGLMVMGRVDAIPVKVTIK